MILLPALLALIASGPQEVVPGSGRVPAASIERVRELVDEGLERLTPLFPGTPHSPFRIFVHRDVDSLPARAADSRHSGSPGLALLGRDEIHLILDLVGGTPPNDLRTLVDHELVHVLLDQYAGDHAGRVPRWFHEGLAQDLAGGSWHNVKEEDLVFRVTTGSLLSFSDLERGFPEHRIPLAYGQSYSFVAFLRRQFGHEAMLAIVDGLGEEDADFNTSLVHRLRAARGMLEERWHDYLLNHSGAGGRVVFGHCFSILMVLSLPVLALALIRRLRREDRIADKLDQEDQEELDPADDGPLDPGRRPPP